MKHSLFFAVIVAVALAACGGNEDYTPKPHAYMRIDMPSHEYTLFDTAYPYRFEYSKHAVITPKHEEPYWINLDYPDYNATLHFSYKPVTSLKVLGQYVEDSRKFAFKHIPKADDIRQSLVQDDSTKVYGQIYEIEGVGVASTCQFFLTDSLHHFVRASLYFNAPANNDSLAPLISYIKQDVAHLIKTFSWNTHK